MISRRYYQFLWSFITINTAFSSPQVFQGQVNDLHVAYSPPFESFDAAASLKDPTNAIPMVTPDQSVVVGCTRLKRNDGSKSCSKQTIHPRRRGIPMSWPSRKPMERKTRIRPLHRTLRPIQLARPALLKIRKNRTPLSRRMHLKIQQAAKPHIYQLMTSHSYPR